MRSLLNPRPNSEVFDSESRPQPLVEENLALIKSRNLIVQFVSRSIKTRYKLFMDAGDVVEVEVKPIGTLRNPIEVG